MKPVVSVVIPTCHRNDLLAKCLDCLAPGVQTLPADQYEVIVTDDGTLSTAEEMVRAQYPWVRWVAGPKRGPAANRNYGADFAKEEWLAFTDDDCLPSLEWLSAYVSAFNSDTLVYEGKTATDANKGLFFSAPINESGGYLWSCNMMLNRSVFMRTGGFDSNIPVAHLEDVDFRMRLVQSGYDFAFVPDALVVHPQRRIASILRQVRDHESSFYMSRKHLRPVSDFGLSVKGYLLTQVRIVVRRSKNPLECLQFLFTRSLVEGMMLMFLTPAWRRKYKHNPG